MGEKEYDLLMKDLCGRLPYGVMCKINNRCVKVEEINPFEGVITYDGWLSCGIDEDIKPYLRPMSSMTESERKEFDDLSKFDEDVWMGNHKVGFPKQARIMSKCVDWLNRKMFDHRGLIPKGLANEAPEGMYN